LIKYVADIAPPEHPA